MSLHCHDNRMQADNVMQRGRKLQTKSEPFGLLTNSEEKKVEKKLLGLSEINNYH